MPSLLLPRHTSLLTTHYPWTLTPLIVSAPMLGMTGPRLATAVSLAGGIGIIGPRKKPEELSSTLAEAKSLLKEATSSTASPRWRKEYTWSSGESKKSPLPIGVGFQTWTGGLSHAEKAIAEHRPAIAWLFAPREGQAELDQWARRIREVSEGLTRIWIQVGTVAAAVEAAQSPERPDVLVVQGQDAGGHGLWRGAGLVTLLPEVVDAVRQISEDLPIIGAGGIADGRGVASVLVLGASGAALGTRFLASEESDVNKGYKDEVVRASDGGQSTIRTTLYNALRGTKGWPEQYAPRTIINQSWVDEQTGLGFEENEKLYQEAVAKGDAGWGPEGRLATYAGTGIGLVKNIAPGGEIVEKTREEAAEVLKSIGGAKL